MEEVCSSFLRNKDRRRPNVQGGPRRVVQSVTARGGVGGWAGAWMGVVRRQTWALGKILLLVPLPCALKEDVVLRIMYDAERK